MAGKKEKRPSLIWMTLKTVLAVFLLLLIIATVAATAESIRDEYEYSSDNVARMISYCDRDYFDRDFGSLLSTLELYGLYGEEFDKYWEAVNAYEDFMDHEEFRGLDGYETDEAQALARIQKNARECKFEENRKLLEGFVEQSQ